MDFLIRFKDERAGAQGMRTDRREDNQLQRRFYDRSTGREGVGS